MMRVRSARARILGWMLLPVLISLLLSFFTSVAVLNQDLRQRIDSELDSQIAELRLYSSSGIDPVTGEVFQSSSAMLDAYLSSLIPMKNEAVFTVVDGMVRERGAGEPPLRLDQIDEFVDLVSSVDVVTIGNFNTEVGIVRYIALPVSSPIDKGVFVAARFLDVEARAIESVIATIVGFGLVALSASALVGWFVAARIGKPIRDMRHAAMSISASDLSRRIETPSRASKDDLAQLAEAFNSMLDRISEAFATQRQFVDDAGHELRTPLTVIQGHLQLLENLSPEQLEHVGIALDEVRRMGRIVQDMQTLTKSSSPGFLQPSWVSSIELMDEIITKARAIAPRNWVLDDIPAQAIWADRQRITQAVLQLAKNSVQHTSEFDTIRIGLKIEEGNLEFSVEDSGPGIPEEERDRITQRFVRGIKQRSDSDGAGLGLAVVQAICQAHLGQLVIGASDLGGARVSIQIPDSGFSLKVPEEVRA